MARWYIPMVGYVPLFKGPNLTVLRMFQIITGELFAKLQTYFYADPVDSVFKAPGGE
ncbi:hypothetical protein JCM12296A_52300 [Desulfosarcina cetonica]